MKVKEGIEMPRRATVGSAGYDFYAPADMVLKPGTWVTVDTGVQFDGTELVKVPLSDPDTGEFKKYIAPYWFMLIVPRSGLGVKHGVVFRNTAGVIDCDYCNEDDEIHLCMTAGERIEIKKGERIAQGILIPFGIMGGEIEPTEMRHGGHGSTGA